MDLGGEQSWTYMYCSIPSSEGKDATDYADKERQALGRKPPEIQEISEYFLGRSVVGHVGERNEDGKEAEDMNYENEALETRQDLSTDAVDCDREDCDRPEKKSSVPALRLVRAVCEDDQRLNESTA